ncbi:hypothetical protein KDL30_14415 [bacterium]|nr:hypothetical protein [bacterium]
MEGLIIVLLAIMSGIILYMLLNQRSFQRLDHTRLNREDEQREHFEHRLRRLEQAMQQAARPDPELAMQLAGELRDFQSQGRVALERTSSLMQSQLATLSARLSELERYGGNGDTTVVRDALLETREQLQELDISLAAEQDTKRRLVQRVELLEDHLRRIDPLFAADQEDLAAVAAGRSISPAASQFLLSNEKYEQIAQMMIRNADFADICRNLNVSRSEIELVEAMAFRRSA